MKKIVLLLTLLLSNATLFSVQDSAPAAKRIKLSDNGAAAADQQAHVPSLQDIATLSTLQIIIKKHPDIYNNLELFEAELNQNKAIPQPVKNLLIAKYKEASNEAARLWVEHHATNKSPFKLLRLHKPELARLFDEGILLWNLSFQHIIDAGGADILASKIKKYVYAEKNCIKRKFNNLSLTSLEGLQNIPGIIQTNTLDLSYNQLTKINPEIFKDLINLTNLNLDNNQLTKINHDTFNSLHQLNSLDLSHNQLTKINPEIFKDLINLTELHLAYNQLIEIHRDTFNSLHQLKSLLLNYNKITIIHPNTFNSLHQLTKLCLDHNQLIEIHRDTFNSLHQLKEFFLNYNKITTIHGDTFNSFNQLKELDLSNNQLTKINPNAFKPLTQLTFLILSNNQLTQEQLDLIIFELPANCETWD
ncbi:MAG: leucine-rich repeat protein [Saprospiraceae bacterium]|nr:leucine-rich repeat protein [Saprospiraceae bacterium]